MGRRKKSRKSVYNNSRNISNVINILAEKNIRKRFTKCTGVENPTELRISYFTRQEMIDKYAKEYAFWSYERCMNKLPTSKIKIAEKFLASRVRIIVITHIREKFSNDKEMLAAIYITSKQFHCDYYGEEMDNFMDHLLCAEEEKKLLDKFL